jgi:hypothetical protein
METTKRVAQVGDWRRDFAVDMEGSRAAAGRTAGPVRSVTFGTGHSSTVESPADVPAAIEPCLERAWPS